MARGGARPGAGRKKGSAKPPEVKAAEQKTDLGTPQFETAKDFGMWVINNDSIPFALRMEALQMVLPYTDAKLAEAAAGKKEQKGQAAKEAAKGKFAPPAPPKLAVDNTK